MKTTMVHGGPGAAYDNGEVDLATELQNIDDSEINLRVAVPALIKRELPY